MYGLRLLVADYRANAWSRIAAYYICHKASAMLSDPEDYSNIKKKIYAIICSIIEEEKEKEKKDAICVIEDEECSICLEQLSCKRCITTQCRHTFHETCFLHLIEQWLQIYRSYFWLTTNAHVIQRIIT